MESKILFLSEDIARSQNCDYQYHALTLPKLSMISKCQFLTLKAKKIVRAIHRVPLRKKVDENNYIYTTTSPLFKDKNILKLSDIYYLHLALFAYDCVHGNVPEFFIDYLLTADTFIFCTADLILFVFLKYPIK